MRGPAFLPLAGPKKAKSTQSQAPRLLTDLQCSAHRCGTVLPLNAVVQTQGHDGARTFVVATLTTNLANLASKTITVNDCLTLRLRSTSMLRLMSSSMSHWKLLHLASHLARLRSRASATCLKLLHFVTPLARLRNRASATSASSSLPQNCGATLGC